MLWTASDKVYLCTWYVLLHVAVSDDNITFDDQKHRSPHIRRARKRVIDSELEDKFPPKVYHKQRPTDKVAAVGADEAAQLTLDYIGDNLDIQYNVMGNDGGRFHVDIVLTNAGSRAIPSCCWAIYLYHMKYGIVFSICAVLPVL